MWGHLLLVAAIHLAKQWVIEFAGVRAWTEQKKKQKSNLIMWGGICRCPLCTCLMCKKKKKKKTKPGWPFISLTDLTLQSVTTSLYSTPADYTTPKRTQMIVFLLAKTENAKRYKLKAKVHEFTSGPRSWYWWMVRRKPTGTFNLMGRFLARLI